MVLKTRIQGRLHYRIQHKHRLVQIGVQTKHIMQCYIHCTVVGAEYMHLVDR